MAVELTPEEVIISYRLLDRIDEILHADDNTDAPPIVTVIDDDPSSDEDGSSDVPSKPPRMSFRKVLRIQEKCCYFMNEGKYTEAYGFMKSMHKLGPQIHFALVLVKYYIALVGIEHTVKANRIRDQLADLFKENFTETSSDLCDYALELRLCDEFIESVLFYQIAFSIFPKEKNIRHLSEFPGQVSSGILICVYELFRDRFISKTIISTYFIALLLDIAKSVESWFSFDKKLCSEILAHCLFHIALCQELTCEFADQEVICTKATTLLKRHHSKVSAMKMSVYSLLLELLGRASLKLGKLEVGVQVLNQAFAARKKTKDLNGRNEKAEDMRRIEETLKIAQKRTSRRK